MVQTKEAGNRPTKLSQCVSSATLTRNYSVAVSVVPRMDLLEERRTHRMCGIFGYVGTRDEAPQLVLAGLKKLEYRGYDSWGIASRQNGDHLARLLVEKHTGKIGQAMTSLPASHAALGHTRWATHGGVTEANAHPHLDCQGRLAVIHNGIIENHTELRRELVAKGHTFASQTDTEVVCHLLEDELRGDDSEAGLRSAAGFSPGSDMSSAPRHEVAIER